MYFCNIVTVATVRQHTATVCVDISASDVSLCSDVTLCSDVSLYSGMSLSSDVTLYSDMSLHSDVSLHSDMSLCHQVSQLESLPVGKTRTCSMLRGGDGWALNE